MRIIVMRGGVDPLKDYIPCLAVLWKYERIFIKKKESFQSIIEV